jgi:hypothetical protein
MQGVGSNSTSPTACRPSIEAYVTLRPARRNVWVERYAACAVATRAGRALDCGAALCVQVPRGDYASVAVAFGAGACGFGRRAGRIGLSALIGFVGHAGPGWHCAKWRLAASADSVTCRQMGQMRPDPLGLGRLLTLGVFLVGMRDAPRGSLLRGRRVDRCNSTPGRRRHSARDPRRRHPRTDSRG